MALSVIGIPMLNAFLYALIHTETHSAQEYRGFVGAFYPCLLACAGSASVWALELMVSRSLHPRPGCYDASRGLSFDGRNDRTSLSELSASRVAKVGGNVQTSTVHCTGLEKHCRNAETARLLFPIR